MTKSRFVAIAAMSVLCLAAFPALTKAYDDCVSTRSLLELRAFGYSGTLYGLGYVPVPPYFALHPPVYYGHRYYQAYGGSPFARQARPIERPRRVMRVIVNPHVDKIPAVEAGKRSEPPQTVQAQMIINPFYGGSETQLADRSTIER